MHGERVDVVIVGLRQFCSISKLGDRLHFQPLLSCYIALQHF